MFYLILMSILAVKSIQCNFYVYVRASFCLSRNNEYFDSQKYAIYFLRLCASFIMFNS